MRVGKFLSGVFAVVTAEAKTRLSEAKLAFSLTRAKKSSVSGMFESV